MRVGPGRDLLWLKQRGYDVLGLERSPGLAELARTHAGCQVLCADFDSFDFTTLSMDALILIGALVHVPKARIPATLSRTLQALKPGGYVLLTMKQGVGWSTAGDGQGLSGVRTLEGCGIAWGFRGSGACGGGGVYQCFGIGYGGDVAGVFAEHGKA